VSAIKHLRYPYEWGVSVVERFIENNVRATMKFAEKANMPVGALKHFLIITLCKAPSCVWEAMKYQIKHEGTVNEAIYCELPSEVRKILNECRVNDEKQLNLL